MGWNAVWQAAFRQFGAETVEIQLAIILALAFSTLMILIGLRHAFRPAGPHQDEPAFAAPRRRIAPAPVLAAMPEPALAPAAPAQPFRARKPAPLAARKLVKPSVCAHAAPRPVIRRAGAPLSPRR